MRPPSVASDRSALVELRRSDIEAAVDILHRVALYLRTPALDALVDRLQEATR